MTEERWLHETEHHLYRIAGMGAEHLGVTPEQLRDYRNRHEAPLEAAQAILTDLSFPPDLIKERSKEL